MDMMIFQSEKWSYLQIGQPSSITKFCDGWIYYQRTGLIWHGENDWVLFKAHIMLLSCYYHKSLPCQKENWTRGPMVLYRSPKCIEYAELKQAWKYMTICSISLHWCRSIRKQSTPYHQNGQGQPSVIIWTNDSTWVPDAAYQVSRSSASWFRRRFLKVFTIYGHGGHLGHVT